jgi:hypothetical protein
MCFWVKNGRILYVGEGVTSTGFASATPSESGNPPGYGLQCPIAQKGDIGGNATHSRKCKNFEKVKNCVDK